MKSRSLCPALISTVILLSLSAVKSAEVNAVATGAWTAGATWSDNNPAAAGNNYTIDGFTVTSPTDNNTVTFPGDAITISKTAATAGILDLARLHATTEQIITTTLPPVTINDGGTLQFRAQTGSNRWNLGNSPINVSGTVLFNNTGGGYAQNINLAGALSGSGIIEYKTANSGSSITERTLTLNAANSTYSGNWFIQHANTGDDFGTLAAGAANALGTGTVTLDTRARLRNNASNGFDSLTGITLNQSTSSVFFNGRDWTNAAGVLTLNNGSANIGTAHLSIASITQAAGTINFTVGGSKDGKLITSGNADFTGGVINIGFGGSPVGKTFDLVTYGGSLANLPVVDAGDTGRLTTVINNGSGTADKVTLSFSGNVATLTWTGNEAGFENDWDNDIALNFDNNGTPDKFRQFDHVTFGNTSGSTTPNLIGTLTPSSLTFNHSTNDYTLGGTGSLSGFAGISKSGTGTLTITGAHTITGQSVLNDGHLRIGNNAALGTGTLTINGGTLSGNDTTARNLAAAVVIANSFTLGDTLDTGAMNLAGPVTLAGNAKVTILSGTQTAVSGRIGGTGNLELERPDSNIARWNLANTANDFQGDITITSGRLWFAPGTTGSDSLGNANNRIIFNGEPNNDFTNNVGRASIQQSSGVPVTLGATREVIINNGKEGTFHTWGGQTFTVHAPISGGGRLRKEDSGTLVLTGNNTYSGGTAIVLGQVNVTSDTAFGTGPVEFRHSASSTNTTRANLVNVTLANDFVLNTNAQTGFRGPINTAAGNTLSTLSGTITIQSGVGNGGHFSSLDGGVLRLTGTINTTGPVVNIRSGTVEMATTGGNLTILQHGEGTLRLVADNGIQSTVDLRLGVSLPSTLDLNGFNQTLAQIKRNVPDAGAGTSHAATVTNTAASPSVLTIDGPVNHSFSGIINNGTGGISLVKKGSSTFTLNGTHTYSGDTTVEGGTLSLNSAYLADSSAVRVTTGATLNLTHGATDTVDKLFIDGIQQPAGTYDADNTAFITGSGALQVTSGPGGDPFASWAGSKGLDGSPGKAAGFHDDPDADGIPNGLEWILGGEPLDGNSGKLVTATATAGGGLTLSFPRNEDAIGQATLTVEYNADLGAAWQSATIGATSSGPDANGVTVTINTAATPDTVTVTIPSSNATGGKLFARLKATQP